METQTWRLRSAKPTPAHGGAVVDEPAACRRLSTVWTRELPGPLRDHASIAEAEAKRRLTYQFALAALRKRLRLSTV